MPTASSPAGLSLRGLIAATFTPLRPDGQIDLPRIQPMVDFLVSQRIGGLYVLGSTGEGVSMTFSERAQVAEQFVRAVDGRLPVIIQVGCDSLPQARELASVAQSVGADAISAVCPVYFKPGSVEALVASMEHIADGAAGLPFYYYHVPVMTGLQLSALDFLQLGRQRIGSLRGIKYTSYDLFEYQSCLEAAGDSLEILWGRDEMLLYGLVAGARAAVGSTYNFAAPIYHRLWSAFKAGDLTAARAEQARAQDCIRSFLAFPALPAQKAILSMVGIDCGPTRLPLPPLTADQTTALRQRLESVGFFQQLD